MLLSNSSSIGLSSIDQTLSVYVCIASTICNCWTFQAHFFAMAGQLHMGDLSPDDGLDKGVGSHEVNASSHANIPRTAEIAANSPRYRRKSSTFIDGIHDVPEDADMAPAQLYSTMSGRLFHSGRIAIVMVGLPARGKTCVPSYSQPLGFPVPAS